MKSFSIKKEFLICIQILKRDEKAIKEAANDKRSVLIGLIVMFISSISSFFGALFLSDYRVTELAAMILAGFLLVIATFMILHYSALKLGGKSDFLSFFGVISRAHILGFLSVIPFANLLMFWQIWIVHRSFILVHGLSPRLAFRAMLWTFFVFLLLNLFIQILFSNHA